MTASLSFQIDKHSDIRRIPNAALRFYPRPEQVRPEDRELLEGIAPEPGTEEQPDTSETRRSATEKVTAARNRSRRHVWIVEGDSLKAVEVVTGLNDNTFTELVSGPLTDGQEVVTGVRPMFPHGP